MPTGVKLSKRCSCFINILAADDATEKAAELERRKMLEFFIAEKDLTWAQQFKFACILGPSIDQDNLIVQDVSGSEAFWQFFAIYWKVFSAVAPPKRYLGGWAAFIVVII